MFGLCRTLFVLADVWSMLVKRMYIKGDAHTYMDIVDELSKYYSIDADTSNEIRNGAMVILGDGGHFYRSGRGHSRCWSEHPSSAPVYDIPGTEGTILVGMAIQGSSWFQWERSPCCSIWHMIDWCQYQWTGRNIGPFGTSARTESNPIKLTPSVNIENIHF